jgi:hypothetical protein
MGIEPMEKALPELEMRSAKGNGPDARLRAEPESSRVPGRVQPAARN